jgi:hypothetical protein
LKKTGRTREPILKKEQRKKQLKSTAYVVFLFDFAGHRCRREEKEKKPVSACCFPGGRAASGGGALLHAPPLFQHCCCDSRSVPLQFLQFWGTIL